MKIQTLLLPCLAIFLTASTGRTIDLKQAKVTQVINDVQIISAADQNARTATVDEEFRMPDILHTGTASRAELVAPDETVTRVGANTIFSFDPATRTIDLKQGSLLFHSPHGKGGGTIRTGSATASVLGTTLIVCATPKGGLKVLDLEGRVEVKFAGGSKQRLDPGQMTIVLPGGNQLSPIIIFRLDELTRHSLLVKGFQQPLASQSLINSQTEKQLKLIQSGKASDTGLYAGDDAGSDKVEVFDANTINHQDRRPKIVSAVNSDATINQPSLTDVSIPSPPNHVFTTTQFALPGNPYFSGETFSGFLARNISISAPAAGSLAVDMSQYAGLGDFDFVAKQNFNLAGAVTFSGLADSDSLTLIGGNQIAFSAGTELLADVKALSFVSAQAMSLDQVSLCNHVGDISLRSGDDLALQDCTWITAAGQLTLTADKNLSLAHSHLTGESIDLESTGGTVALDHSVINAGCALTINSAASVTLSHATINAAAESGSVTLNAATGSGVTITDTAITAHYLTVNSGDGILLEPSCAGLTSSCGGTANLTASGQITASHADFSSFSVVNMAANTINLCDVNLGSGVVSLKSALGLLNVGVAQSGYVNFIQNVTYKGCAAQNFVNNGGGITVAKLF